MTRNQHIKDYLSYYLNFKTPPRFAVLLNGPWGAGKTFFIKDFMNVFDAKKQKHVYISLYGLTSIEEIDGALFRATYPLIENRGIKIAGKTMKALAKSYGFEPDIKVSDLINARNFEIFIFDDLERCEIEINKVLGYINHFVEHEDRKAIIISNQLEIKEGEKYKTIREKLIGRTLEFQSVFDQSIDKFIESIDDDRAKNFIGSAVGQICDLYNNSNLFNLRVLQQTIWDFERIYVVLEDKHRSNLSSMNHLILFFFALSFEIRSGRLDSTDLQERQFSLTTSRMRPHSEQHVKPQIVVAQNRYPKVNLGSTILSDQTIIDILTKGIIDKDKIGSEINASSFFVTVAEEPSWRTVWYAFERTNDQFVAALSDMERAFIQREYTIYGEILHVFGLRIWLSRIGVISKRLEVVVAEGKLYIDDLYKSRKLELPSADFAFSGISSNAYGGLGIHERSTREYEELHVYLKDKMKRAETDRYPDIAAELLADLKNDAESFSARICFTFNGPNEFSNMPVLALIEPSEFTKALLKKHPAQQRVALTALQVRYGGGALDRDLKDERSWAIKVRNSLDSEAESLSPILRYIVLTNLKNTLDVVLEFEKNGSNEGGDLSIRE